MKTAFVLLIDDHALAWGGTGADCGAGRGMLNTLLDFSRIEAGVIQARIVDFPLQTILQKQENHLREWLLSVLD